MTDQLTRIELLRRAALGGTLLTLPGILAACGGDDDGGESAGGTTTTASELGDSLRFSNWQLYIDVDPKTKKSPSTQKFEQETGVTVSYFEDINDNASYFGKIQGPLSQGRGIDRDIIVMTDNSRFPALLISKEWVEKLDKARIPNITNLIDAQMSPPFDPDRSYSLPWASGITGIATNLKASGGDIVTTTSQLLEDPEAEGQGHDADRDGGLDDPRSCSRTATTRATSPTRASTRRTTRSRRRSTPARFAASPATTT